MKNFLFDVEISHDYINIMVQLKKNKNQTDGSHFYL